jgi:hypothetical protein
VISSWIIEVMVWYKYWLSSKIGEKSFLLQLLLTFNTNTNERLWIHSCQNLMLGNCFLKQVYTNKTPVMPFIPTKSVACMSKSWLLGNIYTAKACTGKKRDPDALKLGLVSEGRQPWQKTSALQDSRGLGVGLTTPPWKRLVTKSEEAIAGYFSWLKLLRKAGPTWGCWVDDDDDDELFLKICFSTVTKKCLSLICRKQLRLLPLLFPLICHMLAIRNVQTFLCIFSFRSCFTRIHGQ